jgi:hypothetical protein
MATRPIRRVRHSLESWLDDLDFAQWLFVLCITAAVLLITRRLLDTAARLFRLLFGWQGCFQRMEREIEK